ncbi:hypothetical protein [Chryseobacterium wanjuense]
MITPKDFTILPSTMDLEGNIQYTKLKAEPIDSILLKKYLLKPEELLIYFIKNRNFKNLILTSLFLKQLIQKKKKFTKDQ